MLSDTDIVNAALQQIGDNAPVVTGNAPNFDSSPAGIAAAQLYTNCVRTVARQFGWDFSRNIAALVLSGNPAPVGYSFEYLYPTSGIQVRQLLPAAIADLNDPLPINWTVGNALVAGVPKKVIWTRLANAEASFTNQPPPDLWDAGFVEAVVRTLGSEFASALAGRPDTMRDLLTTGQQFEKLAEVRSD